MFDTLPTNLLEEIGLLFNKFDTNKNASNTCENERIFWNSGIFWNLLKFTWICTFWEVPELPDGPTDRPMDGQSFL